jgi:hypothetical protein
MMRYLFVHNSIVHNAGLIGMEEEKAGEVYGTLYALIQYSQQKWQIFTL